MVYPEVRRIAVKLAVSRRGPPTSSHGHAGDALVRRPLDELI